jgi:hypothetical protein
MSDLTQRMIAKVRKWRDNRPDVVDDLIAALELVPMEKDNPEEWLLHRWMDGMLRNGDYVYLDFLTCEA